MVGFTPAAKDPAAQTVSPYLYDISARWRARIVVASRFNARLTMRQLELTRLWATAPGRSGVSLPHRETVSKSLRKRGSASSCGRDTGRGPKSRANTQEEFAVRNSRLSRYPFLMISGLAGALSICACSSSRDVANSDPSTGTVGLSLLVGDAAVNSISYDISGNGQHKTGTIALDNSTKIATIIGGLPAGNGYVITLTATAANDSTITCSGAATFSVVAGATASVQVHLECKVPARTGSVSVNGTINVCPTLDSLSVSPSEVIVGSSVSLTAAASDEDQGPSPLSYTWTVSGGTLSSTTSTTPSLTCTSLGDVTVQVVVSDGDCSDTASATVTCSAPPKWRHGRRGGQFRDRHGRRVERRDFRLWRQPRHGRHFCCAERETEFQH